VLGVRLRTYLRQAYLAPLLLCTPTVALLLWLRSAFPAHNYKELLLQAIAAGLVYSVGLAWFLLTQEQMGLQLRAKFRQTWLNALRPANPI
jgi:hypothetical protein